MSLKIEISSNAERLARQFERLPERVQTGVAKGLGRALLLIETKVRTRCQKTASGSVKFSGSRSGLSSRLTSYVRKVPGMGLDGAIGFRRTRGFPYELSQEFGARAKPGKAMSIPITDQARRYDSPRDFPEPLRMVEGPRRVVLVSKRSKIGIVAQYVLVKSIPPRLGFRETVTGQADMISAEMVNGAEAAV